MEDLEYYPLFAERDKKIFVAKKFFFGTSLHYKNICRIVFFVSIVIFIATLAVKGAIDVSNVITFILTMIFFISMFIIPGIYCAVKLDTADYFDLKDKKFVSVGGSILSEHKKTKEISFDNIKKVILKRSPYLAIKLFLVDGKIFTAVQVKNDKSKYIELAGELSRILQVPLEDDGEEKIITLVESSSDEFKKLCSNITLICLPVCIGLLGLCIYVRFPERINDMLMPVGAILFLIGGFSFFMGFFDKSVYLNTVNKDINIIKWRWGMERMKKIPFSQVVTADLYSRHYLGDKGFPAFGIRLILLGEESYVLHEEHGLLADSIIRPKAGILVKALRIIIEDKTKK